MRGKQMVSAIPGLREISLKYDCTASTVVLRLREAGILRSKSEAAKLWKRTPESNAKRSAAHKALCDKHGRVAERDVLHLKSSEWKARVGNATSATLGLPRLRSSLFDPHRVRSETMDPGPPQD
jgi:hypothetical protein